jgi:hypothetical protein
MLIEVKTPNGLIPIRNADNETSFIPRRPSIDKDKDGDNSGTYTRYIKGSGSLVAPTATVDLLTNQVGKVGDTPTSVPAITTRLDPSLLVIGPTLPIVGVKQTDATLPVTSPPSLDATIPIKTEILDPTPLPMFTPPVNAIGTLNPLPVTSGPLLTVGTLLTIQPIAIANLTPPPPILDITTRNIGGSKLPPGAGNATPLPGSNGTSASGGSTAFYYNFSSGSRVNLCVKGSGC